MIDLNQFNPDEIRALARIRQMGGKQVQDVIEKVITEWQDALVSASDMVRIHRLQGRVEALRGLLAAVDAAAELDTRNFRV